MKIAQIALRGTQLVFAAIVIGLSVSLAKGQYRGMIPAMTIYAIVCGIAGFVTAVFGMASVFFDDIAGFILFIFDGVSSLILLAGSIAMAAELGVGSCDGHRPPGWDSKGPNPYCAFNPIIAGGAIKKKSKSRFDYLMYNGWFVSRCQMAQADVAFLFFTLFTLLATTFFSFRRYRGSGKNVSVV